MQQFRKSDGQRVFSMCEPTLVLSSQLKGILETRRITIEELANKSQVPIEYISDWIIGAIPHNLLLVKKLAVYLETTMDDLCFELKH